MQTAAKIVVAILTLLFVGGVWGLIQKVTKLISGQGAGAPREQLLVIGYGIVFCVSVMGLALGLSWLAGILDEPW